MSLPITEAEAIVMETLWQQAPRSTEDILAAVGPAQAWQVGTVKSLLNRLLKKQAVKAEQDGRRYLYYPLVSRDEYLSSESEGLLDRLFGGRVAPLVAHFSAHRRLTKRDIAELRKLLDKLD